MARVTRVLLGVSQVLEQMVWLLLLRRLYEDVGSYSLLFDQYPALFGAFYLEFLVTTHSEQKNVTQTRTFNPTFWHLLTTMKINFESTDHCTLAAKHMFDELREQLGRREHRRICFELIKIIVFFGSRRCLADLQSLLRSPPGNVSTKGWVRKVKAAIGGLASPHEWFTRSFAPNRIMRSQVKKSKNPQRVTLKLFSTFSRKAVWRKCGLRKGRRVSKRFAASRLGRTLGSFVGKNFFQLWKLASPTLFNKTRERHADAYSETGPGCRGAINQLEGWPKLVNIYSNNQAIADLYNTLLLKWHKKWKRICKRVLTETPAELQHVVQGLLDLDEGAFQFVLCELVKVMEYSTTESAIYSRDHWADRL